MIIVVLCMSVASILNNAPPSVSGQPSYSVGISMPNRRLNPLFDRTINMTFTISGVGSFVDASVKVSSDSPNLVKNSLTVRGYYWATDGKLHPFFDSAEVNYTYTTTVGTSFSRATNGEIGFSGLVPGVTPGYLDSSRIQLLGGIIVDSSGMSSGSYTIKVTFTVHKESGNYKFDDSVNYEILDFWQANPWAAPLVAGLILAALLGSWRYLRSRLSRNRWTEPQERTPKRRESPEPKDQITVKRRYRNGKLETEEFTIAGQNAVEKYVDGMSKSFRLEAVTNTEVIDLIRQDRYVQAEVEAKKITEAIESSRTRENTLELSQLYLIRGDAAFNTGHFAEAEQLYSLSLELAKEVKDESLSTAAYVGVGIAKGSQGDDIGALGILERIQNVTGSIVWQNKGRALLNLGRYDEAVELYNQNLRISRNLQDQEEIAVYLHQLGIIAQDKGNYDEAKRHYNESLTIERKLGNLSGIATTLNQLGLVEQERGNYDDANKMFGQALEIYRKTGEQLGIAMCLNNLGLIAQNRGNYDDATRLYHQALEIMSKVGDQKRIAMTTGNLAIIAREKGNYDEARRSFNQARLIFETLGARPELAICLNNLGAVEHIAGNYDEAARLYHLSLDMIRQLGFDSKVANTLRNLGDIASHKGDQNEAAKLYKESLKISMKLHDQSGIARSLHSLGIVEQHRENYDEAKRLYDESLQIRLKLGEQLGIAQTLHQLANIDYLKRSYDEARILYERSLALNRAVGNRLGEAITIGMLGALDEVQGLSESAEKHYQEAHQIFDALGRKEDLETTKDNLERVRSRKNSSS